MKVSELINVLMECDKDSEVVFDNINDTKKIEHVFTGERGFSPIKKFVVLADDPESIEVKKQLV